MAKKQPTETKTSNDAERVAKYVKEFNDWRTDLKQYWPQMEKNEEMYQFYKREYSQSDVDISLNTPFSIVESQIAKENKSSIQVTVRARGENGMDEFENWIASVVKNSIEDPDIAVVHGSFRKIKEQFSRQLKVVGNSVAEINYCYRTETVNGKRKVVADNPYTKVRHWKSLIFNPTRQMNSSDVYYVEDYVKLSDLTSKEYNEVKNTDGTTTKKGIYKNLDQLKKSLEDDQRPTDDTEGVYFISGDKKVNRKNEPIHILTRWEGTNRIIIANDRVIIAEHTDPFKIGRHNLLIAQRYSVVGRPYAYGEIDAIYKPVRAQDTIMSQSIEMVNKYLRGSYVLGNGVDIDSFLQVLEQGGAMYGDYDQVKTIPVNVPPGQSFQSIQVLQQAIERAARYSPYAAGTPSQQTDQTQGTASGIQALQSAAEPNSEIQTDDLEEMFMQPLGRIYLMMIANFMTEDDVRYALMENKGKQWVKASKNILTGKATLQDMLTSGLVSEEEVQALSTTQQVDPMTGQMVLVPIPGVEEALVFDVDWLVDVKLDSQSASGKERETAKQLTLIQLAQQMGVPLNTREVISYLAMRQDFEKMTDLMLSEQEVQQQQMQAMQMQPQIPAQMPQEQAPMTPSV